MGQDSWNLQYGKSHAAKYRKGASVDMHPDEGYGGPKMIPGYAGAYRNSKAKVIGKRATVKPDGNPRTFGPERIKKSVEYGRENGEFPVKSLKRRK